MSFSSLRFSQYAADLSKAVRELSREETMGATTDLRTYLGDDSASVRFEGSKKVVTVGGRTIEVSPTATNEEIAQALKINKPGSTMTDQLPTVDIAPKAVEPIKKNLTGASFLAGLIRRQMADTKKQLDQAGQDMQTAMKDLQDVATAATDQVKAVQAETADLKAALGLNSNGEPA